ncbi:MAG: asparagine synthase C-terminal domain-containing protein, partial [Prevotellaceae bacterium]|nr:asparagine synthase C-terminal domain-containing protein [Prevotellaceae bacterium]
KGIYQIKPSCYLKFENGKTEQKEYFFYIANKNEIEGQVHNDSAFGKVLENVFKRLIQSANGRQIAVPLSGGYDSRLIVAMLKKIDYQNVICYTVGRENNPEYLIAKEVSKKLGYPYYFIFTGGKKFIENYTADETFQRYYRHSGALCQSFWMYEYFGVKYLYDNNLVEKDAVFVPGHSGDFLAGSHTTGKNVSSTDTLQTLIKKLKNELCCFGNPNKKYIKKLSQIIDFQENYISTSIFDDVVIKTRLARLINNSARLYEFFDYDVRLPFWDNEMLEFFRTLQPELKYNKFFYTNCLKNSLFKEFDINFEHELQEPHKKNPLQPIKDFVKPFAPKFVFRLLSKYQDDTCMNEITAPLYDDLKKAKIKLNTIFVNEPYSKWYLMKIKEDLKIEK